MLVSAPWATACDRALAKALESLPWAVAMLMAWASALASPDAVALAIALKGSEPEAGAIEHHDWKDLEGAEKAWKASGMQELSRAEFRRCKGRLDGRKQLRPHNAAALVLPDARACEGRVQDQAAVRARHNWRMARRPPSCPLCLLSPLPGFPLCRTCARAEAVDELCCRSILEAASRGGSPDRIEIEGQGGLTAPFRQQFRCSPAALPPIVIRQHRTAAPARSSRIGGISAASQRDGAHAG